MIAGDRVYAFDKFDWIAEGRPENRERFWKPATILYENPHYPGNVTIRWDHGGPRNTSHNHRIENLRSL